MKRLTKGKNWQLDPEKIQFVLNGLKELSKILKELDSVEDPSPCIREVRAMLLSAKVKLIERIIQQESAL